MLRKSKAQSTLEYILILSAIIAGIVAMKGRMQKATMEMLDNAGTAIERESMQFLKSVGNG